jgi:hypothetical protein
VPRAVDGRVDTGRSKPRPYKEPASFLFQVEFVVERQYGGGAANHDFVGAGREFPFVGAVVPDGEVFGFDGDADLFGFAGLEPDFAPADEALGWFAGGCR